MLRLNRQLRPQAPKLSFICTSCRNVLASRGASRRLPAAAAAIAYPPIHLPVNVIASARCYSTKTETPTQAAAPSPAPEVAKKTRKGKKAKKQTKANKSAAAKTGKKATRELRKRLRKIEKLTAPLDAVDATDPSAAVANREAKAEKLPPGSKEVLDTGSLAASKIEPEPLAKQQPQVPSLTYGLDRVLFNSGVFWLQDPHSHVFNFDPYLARIMPVAEFDFDALKQYVTSSEDKELLRSAVEAGAKYSGSTSSMSATLSHFHYLLSDWRPLNPEMLSRGFPIDSHQVSRINRAPVGIFLHWKNDAYAIDADKEFDTENVLALLGRSMEKLFTLPKHEYEKYRLSKSSQLSENERNRPESYNFTRIGDILIRSQLDAYDPRLPGTGMFDLKTRSVVTIRHNIRKLHNGLGYEIRDLRGEWESFEREYWDMVRSAFLKYSLQVRMGRMNGIFVAFHNTERIFGFQYIPLRDMDLALHGTAYQTAGDSEFRLSVALLNKVLDCITARFPKQTLRLHFETRPGSRPFMYIFAKTVRPDEVERIQKAHKTTADKLERVFLQGRKQNEGPAETSKEGVEEAGEDETTSSARDGRQESIEEAVEEVIDEVEEDIEDAAVAEGIASDVDASNIQDGELAGYVLTIVNRIGNKPVDRLPVDVSTNNWHVDYRIVELKPSSAERAYKQLLARRRQVYEDISDEGRANRSWQAKLHEYASRGRKFRAKITEKRRKYPVEVLGHSEGPYTWDSVFGEEAIRAGTTEYEPTKRIDRASTWGQAGTLYYNPPKRAGVGEGQGEQKGDEEGREVTGKAKEDKQVKGDANQEAKGKLKQEVQEEPKEEVKEKIKEDVKEDVKEEAKKEPKEEIKQSNWTTKFGDWWANRTNR